jgi:hypothetical protein
VVRPGLSGTGSSIGYIVEVVSSFIVTVDFDGIEGSVKYPAGLTPTVGDLVMVARFGSSRWLIAILVEYVAPPEPPPTPVPPPADPTPAPKPQVRTGTSTFLPVQSSTYRDGKWRDDGNPISSFDIYQGRYSGSGFGRMTGVFFYGNGPSNLAGATVTDVDLSLKRLSAGSYAKRSSTLRLVTQKTRPGGAPTLNESTSGPSLAPGESNTSFDLPNSWGQALVDGDRGGIATSISSDEPYMRHAGRNSSSSAGRLKISWRKVT